MNLEQDIEELFPPRPGGMVDTIRKQREADAGQLANADVVAEQDNVSYEAIRVTTQGPDIGTARTVTLSAANPVLPLLPADRTRSSAVIIAVDNDVYISQDQNTANTVYGAATNGQAFYLPKGVSITIDNQGDYWAACTTTGTASRVSVLVSKNSGS